MAAKAIFAICASALFVQSAVGQCWNRAPLGGIGPKALDGWGGIGCGAGLRAPLAYDGPCGIGADIAAASALNAAWGGEFGVTSSSAIPPTGINVASENVYEGSLAVGGNLPFLGTVAMEGAFPSVGAGAISYGCGNGAVGITAEGIAPSGIVAPGAAIAPAAGLAAPLGLGYKGYAGRVGSCGCNTIY
ncbi:hypothetical protein K1T71_014175 [Dendrolimus kikuchii]|uniref:Uncharacterized protein n=1 Tax=Dendrolimus kikuchii TaxID=765133 RepID=A0ACC1CFI4_9NEOP|nr:hypothetical protein K1T71_014175 [Dendrolimus kikuchii]